MQYGIALNLSQAELIVSRKPAADGIISFCPATAQLLEKHGYKVIAAAQHYRALSHAKAAVLIARDLEAAKKLKGVYTLSDAQAHNLGVYLYHFLCIAYYLYFSTRSYNRSGDSFFWVSNGDIHRGSYRDMFLHIAEQGKVKITSYSNPEFSAPHYLLAEGLNRLLARALKATGKKTIIDFGDQLPSKITDAMIDAHDDVMVVGTRKIPKNMYKTLRAFLKSLASAKTKAEKGNPVWFFRAADPKLYRVKAALPDIKLAYPEITETTQAAIQSYIPFLKAEYGIGKKLIALIKPEMIISDFAKYPYVLAAQEEVKRYGGIVAMMNHGSHTVQEDAISKLAGDLWAAQDRLITPFVTEHAPKSPLTYAITKTLRNDSSFRLHKLNLFQDIKTHPSEKDEFMILHAGNFMDVYYHIPWCKETSEEYLLAIYELLDEMRHIEGARLVIKLKASKAHLHKQLIQERIDKLGLNDKVVIDLDSKFSELLAKTSLVISNLSGTVEEALINHIPVMIHTYYKNYFHIPPQVLAESGLNPAYLVKKRSDIKDIIHFAQKNRSNLFNPELYANVAWQRNALTGRKDFATELRRLAESLHPPK